MIAPGPVAEPRFITRWASRASLAYPALAPGYAKIDSRGFAGRVADMVHFAREVPFVNLGDVEDGDWEALFTGDDAILLALLSTLDVDGPRARADALIAQIRSADDLCRQEWLVRELARLVLRLAARLDGWLAAAEGQSPGSASRRLFERLAADHLGPRLRRLLALVRAIEESGYFEESVIVIVAECGSIRFIEIEVELEPWEGPWLERAIDELLDSVTAFLTAAHELVAASRAALESSLDEPVHAPQVGLLFAFARIFGHAADSLNALPVRLADFYRQAVLRADGEPALPDRLFAALTPIPVPGAPPPRIVQGSVFPAGKDAQGKPIAFAADSPLAVTGARIDELRLWQSEGRLRAKSFPLPPGGAAAAAFASAGTLPDAAIGLAVASPLLDLRSGLREVSFTLSPLSTQTGAASLNADFPVAISQCFKLAVSGAGGWEAVPDLSVHLELRQTGLALIVSFSLAPDFPALMPPVPPRPDMPAEAAVRLMLVEGASLFGMSAFEFFGAAEFESLLLEISVDGLGGLGIATPGGVAAVGPGLMPFGSAPLPRATLRIDHPAFSLGLDQVTLELDWTGLPPEGFADYYRQYTVAPNRHLVDSSAPLLFTNQSFTVEFRAPVGPADADPWHGNLFASTKSGTLQPSSLFVCRTRNMKVAVPGRPLTLTLTGPAYGFGDTLYPVNVANAVATMAGRTEPRNPPAGILLWLLRLIRLLATPFKLGGQALKRLAGRKPAAPGGEAVRAADAPQGPLSPAAAMPNPPWRPALSNLRVGYKVSATFPSDQATSFITLFHVGAFGGLTELRFGGRERMLPPGPASGAFDLRLSGWAGDLPLSILFLLGPPDPGAPRPTPVEWSYGGGESWAPIPAGPDFDDGTAGLTAAGILSLPPLDTGGSDVWLRGSFAGAPPPVARILPDALGATRIVTGNEAVLAPVPPETLRSPAGLAGIARVEQPLASFGGAPAEGGGDELQRVAQRIGTRARGILAEDVERLALERFPDIARVRLAPAGPEPGGLRLTVVPAQGGGPTPPDPVRPRAPASLREDLHDWLVSVSSPFSRISVDDPVYTAVDLDIAAAFADPAADPDRLRAELQALLSPWADPGLDLDDGVCVAALEGAIVRFVAERAYVASVVRVALSLPSATAAGWSVPVPGAIEILAVPLHAGGC